MILSQHKPLDEDWLVMPWHENNVTLVQIKLPTLQLSIVMDKDEVRKLITGLTDTLREISFQAGVA